MRIDNSPEVLVDFPMPFFQDSLHVRNVDDFIPQNQISQLLVNGLGSPGISNLQMHVANEGYCHQHNGPSYKKSIALEKQPQFASKRLLFLSSHDCLIKEIKANCFLIFLVLQEHDGLFLHQTGCLASQAFKDVIQGNIRWKGISSGPTLCIPVIIEQLLDGFGAKVFCFIDNACSNQALRARGRQLVADAAVNVNSTFRIFGTLTRVRLDQVGEQEGRKQNGKQEQEDLLQTGDAFQLAGGLAIFIENVGRVHQAAIELVLGC